MPTSEKDSDNEEESPSRGLIKKDILFCPFLTVFSSAGKNDGFVVFRDADEDGEIEARCDADSETCPGIGLSFDRFEYSGNDGGGKKLASRPDKDSDG